MTPPLSLRSVTAGLADQVGAVPTPAEARTVPVATAANRGGVPDAPPALRSRAPDGPPRVGAPPESVSTWPSVLVGTPASTGPAAFVRTCPFASVASAAISAVSSALKLSRTGAERRSAWVAGLAGFQAMSGERDRQRARQEFRRGIAPVDCLTRRERRPEEAIPRRHGIEDAQMSHHAPVRRRSRKGDVRRVCGLPAGARGCARRPHLRRVPRGRRRPDLDTGIAAPRDLRPAAGIRGRRRVEADVDRRRHRVRRVAENVIDELIL